MSAFLTACNLSIGYRTAKGQHLVRSGLNFALHSGALTCLLGANGTGKSTLLRTLAAMQPPLDGTLLLDNKPLEAYKPKELSHLIGIVLTEKTQAGALTVAELVGLGRQPHTGFFGRLRQRDRQLVAEAMEQVGIAHKGNSYVAELSDGERQKAMIAKALVQECPLILLDEPTAFLDTPSRIDIMLLLQRLAVEQGKAILLSTHDTDLALSLADTLWLFTPEAFVCGPTDALVREGQVARLFNAPHVAFDPLRRTFAPVG